MISVSNNLSEIKLFAEWSLKTSPDNIIIIGDIKNGRLFAEEREAFILSEKNAKTNQEIYPRILLKRVLKFAEEKGSVPRKSLLLPFEGRFYLIQEGGRRLL